MLSDKKGSFTIEATIVFSSVLFVVIAVIYICLMLYQQVYLQTFADKVAQRAANNWSYPGKDMFFGFVSKEDIKNNSIYWRIMDLKEGDKLSSIVKYAKYDYGKYSLLPGPYKFECTAKVNSEYIVLKKITVTATSVYNNPAGNLLKSFGFKKVFDFEAVSEAVVNEPAEFIRNADFAIDTIREWDNRTGHNFQDFQTKVVDKLSKTFAKINDLMK